MPQNLLPPSPVQQNLKPAAPQPGALSAKQMPAPLQPMRAPKECASIVDNPATLPVSVQPETTTGNLLLNDQIIFCEDTVLRVYRPRV